MTKTKIDTNFLQKAAQAAFAVLRARRSLAAPARSLVRRRGEGGGFKKDISLVFVGDVKMKELNKEYRGKNKVTDVLSFEELNEIFICVPQAKRQAKHNPHLISPLKKGRKRGGKIESGLLKTGLKAELTRLLTHGIVHLSGYDHAKSAQEADRMFRVEEKILEKL